MANEIIEGHQPSPADRILLEAYRQELVKQAERFDDLAKELVKLELAIPGIYAAALRLMMDKQVIIPFGWVGVAFALWLIALLKRGTVWGRRAGTGRAAAAYRV